MPSPEENPPGGPAAGDPGDILLIFDCDGVLVDSEILAHQALVELLAAFGHTITVEEAMRRFAGLSLKDARALCEKMLGRPVPQEVGDEYGRRLLARFQRELELVVGVEEALAALPYEKCVASSSTPDRLLLSLEVTGLAPLFGGRIFSAADVPRGKPAPDLFLLAARSLGRPPSRCIVIEDSPLGIEAARAAGMRAIGFAGASHADEALAGRLTGAGADIVVRAMSELPAAAERLLGEEQADLR